MATVPDAYHCVAVVAPVDKTILIADDDNDVAIAVWSRCVGVCVCGGGAAAVIGRQIYTIYDSRCALAVHFTDTLLIRTAQLTADCLCVAIDKDLETGRVQLRCGQQMLRPLMHLVVVRVLGGGVVAVVFVDVETDVRAAAEWNANKRRWLLRRGRITVTVVAEQRDAELRWQRLLLRVGQMQRGFLLTVVTGHRLVVVLRVRVAANWIVVE